MSLEYVYLMTHLEYLIWDNRTAEIDELDKDKVDQSMVEIQEWNKFTERSMTVLTVFEL